ncbi:MAG: hypothetical protein AAFZ38_10495 [Myxococcota bacterium]
MVKRLNQFSVVALTVALCPACFDLEGVPNRSERSTDSPGQDADGSDGSDEDIAPDDLIPDDEPFVGSLQQQAFDDGNVQLADGSGLSLGIGTLAVSGIVPETPQTSLPAGYIDAPYYGAVEPSVLNGDAWWQGWTLIDDRLDGNLPGANFHPLQEEIEEGLLSPSATHGCTAKNAAFKDAGTVSVFSAVFPVCVIDERIRTDTTLSNDHVYVLKGAINVGDGDAEGLANNEVGPVVIIEEGTQIYGASNELSYLAITRGSRIAAIGSRDLPIIFGAIQLSADGASIDPSSDPVNLTDRGLWAGLILSGNDRTNLGDDTGEAISEAAEPEQPRFYGGTMSQDNSGSLSFLIIAETGLAVNFSEIQALTLETVGGNTSIEHVQVVSANDDCVQINGGTVRVEHFVCVGMDDDGIDIDEGYQGGLQFAIVTLGDEHGHNGIESDSNFATLPISSPILANVLVTGGSGRDDTETRGVLHREGFAGQIYRSVFTDIRARNGFFQDGCLNINDELPNELRHFDSVFNCSGGTELGLSKVDE